MSIQVVTTWNNRLHTEYAHIFESSYNWSFPYTVYNEDVDMFDRIPELKLFVDRNRNRYIVENDYRFDAVRFCYKVFAYVHAILNAPEGTKGIIGIDADSKFVNPIDEAWIDEHIHRDDCMMTYLGRGNDYSECGFLYFNLQHPDIFDYARAMRDMYVYDKIYDLQEYHDSFIWDFVRMQFESVRGTKNHNIGDGRWGHVQARSILGTVYDHLKGNRKSAGRSPESDLYLS